MEFRILTDHSLVFLQHFVCSIKGRHCLIELLVELRHALIELGELLFELFGILDVRIAEVNVITIRDVLLQRV